MTVNLHTEARAFAQQLQDLLDAVLPVPGDTERQVDALHLSGDRTAGDVRYAVQVGQDTKPGSVALLKDGQPVASLLFRFSCIHDSSSHYLAVQYSNIELHAVGDRTPLLRLDFVKGADKVPAAHWNVHAERGSLARLLAQSNPGHTGRLSKVHIPVGGSRMRPCLEDILQLCLVELGIDRVDGAMRALQQGRERWRRAQAAALVRDAPDEAARVLTDLGYRVEPPGEPTHRNTNALRNW